MASENMHAGSGGVPLRGDDMPMGDAPSHEQGLNLPLPRMARTNASAVNSGPEVNTVLGQHQYPDPSQYGAHPYPTNTASNVDPYRAAYGPFPGHSSHQSGGRTITSLNGSAGTLSASFHLASPSLLTEAQRIAQEFHSTRGDPGDRCTRATSNSYSAFPNYYDDSDTGGGRAAARDAYYRAVEGNRALAEMDEPTADRGVDGLDDAEPEFEGAGLAGSTQNGRSRKKRGWRQLLKGTDHEEVGRVKSATARVGLSRSRGPGRGRGRGRNRKGIDPGREFKDFMQQANKYFMEGDLDNAIDNVRQAIQANPEVYHAHSLLSEILKARGYEEESIQALANGAHTARNPDVWQMVAGRLMECPDDLRTPARIKQAIECYGEALKLIKPDEAQLEVRAAKYELYKELGSLDNKGARLDCKSILRIFPYKTYFVAEYALLCSQFPDKSEQGKAIECYENAFKYYSDNHVTFGDEDDERNPWEHLNIYLDLIEMCGNPLTGIQTAKRVSRWFLGRRDEAFWDRYSEDDREFDVENDRRVYVEEWQQGKARHDESLYGAGIPIDIKVRIGQLRLQMGSQYQQEAIMHFRPLLDYADLVEDYHDVFKSVAASLRGAAFLKEAADFYDPLFNYPDAEDPVNGLDEETWWLMGTCYQAVLRNQEAITCFEVVLDRKGTFCIRAKARLARLYEDENQLDKARFLCHELISIERYDLLIDGGVKMVPQHIRALHRRLPPTASGRPRYPAHQSSPGSLRELRPAGPDFADLNGGASTTGPLSRPVRLPNDSMPRSLGSRSGRGRKRKRGILSTISGDVNGAENDDENQDDDGLTPKRPILLKKPRAPTKAQLASQDRLRRIQNIQSRVEANYAIVRDQWPALRKGEDEEAIEEWVTGATAMLDEFTSMRLFFPDRATFVKIKEVDPTTGFRRDPHATKDLNTPGEFLQIPFTEWHRVFTELALVYAKSGEQDKCYRIVQDILAGANVFYLDPEIKMTTNAASIYCGLIFNDSQFLIDLARNLIKDSDYRAGETFQLFAAVNRFSFGSNWFSAGPSQKFMLRMVKAFDYLAMTPDLRDRFDWSLQKPSLEKKAQELDHVRQELDPGVLLMYGHMVAVANHSFSALPYYYRALALQPDNVCVNLSIAAMWIQNSMKRQTENRQFGITQGLAYLYRYYDLRVASGKAVHKQEAEYNVARMWHYLGLAHLALPGYERVLDLSEQVRAELEGTEDGADVEDFAVEAAFALQTIYALSGNDRAARVIMERWLVI